MSGADRTPLGRLAAVAATAFGLLAGSLAGEPATPHFSPEELEQARAVLGRRLAGCADANECASLYAQIALVERPGGAVEALAREQWLANIGRTRARLFAIYPQVALDAKAEILEAFREHWSLLFRGTYAGLTSIVVDALESDDDRLRIAAARLAATRPVPRISHAMIDAATLDPALLQAAALAVGQERARYAARWLATDALPSDDPGVLAAVRWSVFQIGREPAAALLKETIEGDDDRLAARAVEVLLPIVINDDAAVLERWLVSRGKAHPELAERVRRTLAGLESGLFERRAPPQPEPELPAPATR